MLAYIKEIINTYRHPLYISLTAIYSKFNFLIQYKNLVNGFKCKLLDKTLIYIKFIYYLNYIIFVKMVGASFPLIMTICLSIVVISTIMKKIKQPYVVAYILAGLAIGPYGLKIIDDTNIIIYLGNIGVVLLLFFIGMEVNLKELIKNWKIAVIGTFLQIILSILFTFMLSYFLNWSLKLALLLGFAISISSTAVVIKILENYNELHSRVGQNVLSILLVQDIAIVPMLITLNFLAGEKPELTEIFFLLTGSILLILLFIYLVKKETIKFPFSNVIKKDHELQVFWALILCFGFSMMTGLFGLSTALGSFVAGIILASAKETAWVKENLHSFHIILVAMFFVSIGMLIDISFIISNILEIMGIVIGVFITNTFINALILMALKNSFKESLYGGALLSQIGEFSFVLSAVGLNLGIIGFFGYNLTISAIALTLLLSPLWITIFKKLLNFKN